MPTELLAREQNAICEGTRETPLSLFDLNWPRCKFPAIFCGHREVCCTPVNLLPAVTLHDL